jgi:hypothetical protein
MIGLFVKKVHVLNKGVVYLINDIFWNCGFKSRMASRYYFDYCYHCDYFATIVLIAIIIVLIAIILLIDIVVIIVLNEFCSQIRADFGIGDSIWVVKRAAIAKRVEDLGDQSRLAMQNGWLAYVKKTYSAYADEYEAAMGRDELIVPDDE